MTRWARAAAWPMTMCLPTTEDDHGSTLPPEQEARRLAEAFDGWHSRWRDALPGPQPEVAAAG
ncbi:hypothetical protein [Amycolatopsis magusensis]|uniref:Uncharacterized protein n=1 Tax=Amycolatopsis magusensis TaxID=882444 RepID=A0ABS4PU66_9PSEU|nr:hypothetical protein [Amycolatopsis magusensis]MBP2182977.1 hypothetical protein [Amycolatopsis magusensis]